MMAQRKVIILGAAGRDFHNFNIRYKDIKKYLVVAFTAAQIPEIDGRRYPAELAGDHYPNGIPIYPEKDLSLLIKKYGVHECIFSYSDISYQHVMSMCAEVQSAGASFVLPGPRDTMIKSSKPVISVCAVRTGCGKSQTSRRVIELLMRKGLKVIAIRHPMPYGNLIRQRVQRFSDLDDLKRYNCTIEEMEEYEPHITRGNVIYAGVDYEAILKEAEHDPKGCDIIVWDGGNNDFPFYESDLLITVTDPHRVGHESGFYPGETNLKMADVVIMNKMDSAGENEIELLRRNIARINPSARVIEADSPIRVDYPQIIKDKKVLVIEDGPTLTHGGMHFGAGVIAARKFGAASLVDPRPYLTGSLQETFKQYPDIGLLLPAVGYSEAQLYDLEQTVEKSAADSVIIATPIDLAREIRISKPNTRVYYYLQEKGDLNLEEILDDFISEHEEIF